VRSFLSAEKGGSMRGESFKLKTTSSKRGSLKLKTFPFRENSLKLKTSKTDARITNVNRIAQDLASKFGKPEYIPFFRKCAWHLTESQIYDIKERADKQANTAPIYYFIAAAKSEMSHT